MTFKSSSNSSLLGVSPSDSTSSQGLVQGLHYPPPLRHGEQLSLSSSKCHFCSGLAGVCNHLNFYVSWQCNMLLMSKDQSLLLLDAHSFFFFFKSLAGVATEFWMLMNVGLFFFPPCAVSS